MIPNYRPPLHEIEQDFASESPNPSDRKNVIVIGTSYVHADKVAENLVETDYSAGASLAYQMVNAEGVTVTKAAQDAVDTDWSTVLGYGLWLQLYTKGSSGGVAADGAFNAYAPSRNGRTIQYQTSDNSGFLNTGSDAAAQDFDLGRSIQTGDILRIAGDKATVDRKVVGLAGVDNGHAVTDYGFAGASALVAAAVAPVTGVIHSAATVVVNDVTLDTSALAGDDLTDWARRYAPASPDAGLRLRFDLKALTAGDADTATFSLVLQDRSVGVTNASDLGTGTDFTFLGEVINIDRNTWTAGETLSFSVDIPSDAESFPLSGATVNFSTAYNFTEARKKIASSIVVQVTDVSLDGASVKVRVSDTQGLMTPVGKTIAGADSVVADYDGVEDALTVTLTADFFANCHSGQRLSASVTPPSRSSTIFDKVILDAPVGDILTTYDGSKDSLAVTAFVGYSGNVPEIEPISGTTNFTPAAETLELEAAIVVSVSGYAIAADSVKPALSGKGSLAVSWRAISPVGSNEVPFLVTGADSILSKTGSYDLASELGFGLLKAISAAQKGVYGLRVGGTTIADWTEALKTLATLKNIYAVVPLTDDEEVLKLFSAHAAEMNKPSVKKFRRIYAAVDSPGEYTKYSAIPDGSPTTATITVGDGGGYTLVTYGQAAADLEDFPIYEGDKLKVVSTGDEYVIAYRGNDKTLVLKSGPGAPIPSATAVEIIAADTADNISRYVWQYAERLGANIEEDRRINCVWTDAGVFDDLTGAPIVIPNRFGAAEIGGHRVALFPQQSLTRQKLNFITDSPNMYSRFTEDQLNEMAAHGVWIVTQDGPDETPYCRHQLTTASDGTQLQYEDSAGVIYDFVSFAVDDVIEPLIGKRNVTHRTRVEIKNKLLTEFLELTTAPTDADESVGPMLAGFFDREGNEGTLNVDFDPDFKDAFVVFSELEVPLTLNNVRSRLLARTINTASGATSEILVQPA